MFTACNEQCIWKVSYADLSCVLDKLFVYFFAIQRVLTQTQHGRISSHYLTFYNSATCSQANFILNSIGEDHDTKYFNCRGRTGHS